jgi:hypothetical protein
MSIPKAAFDSQYFNIRKSSQYKGQFGIQKLELHHCYTLSQADWPNIR